MGAAVPFVAPHCLPQPGAITGREQAWGQSVHHPAMLRIHGDRNSLLAALTAHWAEQQLQILQPLRPVVAPINRWTRPMR
jgi:hypothetical protein